MGWYAVENIEDAVDETKDLLLPFDLNTWLKLAVIVIFTGGMGGFNIPGSFPSDTGSKTFSGSGTSGTAYAPDASLGTDTPVPVDSVNSLTGMTTAAPSLSTAAMAALAFGLAGIVLVLLFLTSIFEFIFYQSLIDKDVQIRENFSRHSGKGLRYFGFRLGYITVLLLVIATIVGILSVQPVAGGLSLLVAAPLLIGMAVFAGLTKDFALLKMIETEKGLVSSWKELWPELEQEWKQVGMFILVKFFLKIGIGIIGLILLLVVTLVLLIPFGILGFLLYMASPDLIWLAAIPGLITWIVLVLLTKVPLQTYLYSYVILVYHDLTQ